MLKLHYEVESFSGIYSEGLQKYIPECTHACAHTHTRAHPRVRTYPHTHTPDSPGANNSIIVAERMAVKLAAGNHR